MFKKQSIILCKILIGVLLFTCNAGFASNNAETIPDTPSISTLNKNIFNLFSYDELVEMSKQMPSNNVLSSKINYALKSAVIDNTIAPNDSYTYKDNPKIGKYIRVATWNIERGMNLDSIKQAFTDSDSLLKKIKKTSPENLKIITEQLEDLKKADVIVLNEVDVGMPRTQYRNVVEELAKTLHYNYAFGTEFLEVDPGHLGISGYKWSEERFLFPNTPYIVDKDKYKGLHGTAILTRFKIRNPRILRFTPAYDWYDGERNKIGNLENVKRNVAEKIFKEGMIREVRVGGRMGLIIDLDLPDYDMPLTIAGVHLENRAIPKKRREQLGELLARLTNIGHPVVLAGDFNTTCGDGSPTTLLKEVKTKIKDPNFLLKQIILYGNPYSLAINSTLTTTNFARKYSDPTVKNMPIIAPNPERGLFNELREFNFSDGNAFDFRGDAKRSTNGRSGALSNSNERNVVGFVPTFMLKRGIGIGKYKLDWIFVKAFSDEDNEKNASYRMAPHFGKTLFELNYAFEDPLSDHTPITVDLPLYEPAKPVKKHSKSKK